MKLSFTLAPRRPLDRPTAWSCLLSNQLVLPGLGSLVAGRPTGYFQAALALSGLTLTAVFALWFFKTWFSLPASPQSWQELLDLATRWKPFLILGALGFGLFGAGWLWALASSIMILNEALD